MSFRLSAAPTIEIEPRGPETMRPQSSPTALPQLWLDVHALRHALIKGSPLAVEHAARGLLSSLSKLRVQVELAYAAAAFAEGLEDRAGAEDWVTFAVSARAALERARKNGASALGDELDALDATLEDAREAVLLLEPEDYRDALGGTPPHSTAWWGERARLDRAVREIDLERALGRI